MWHLFVGDIHLYWVSLRRDDQCNGWMMMMMMMTMATMEWQGFGTFSNLHDQSEKILQPEGAKQVVNLLQGRIIGCCKASCLWWQIMKVIKQNYMLSIDRHQDAQKLQQEDCGYDFYSTGVGPSRNVSTCALEQLVLYRITAPFWLVRWSHMLVL